MGRKQFTPEEAGSRWLDVIARDPGNLPETYFFDNKIDYGLDDIPIDRYLDAAWHRLEVEKVWKKVWQFAGFEEDMPNVGDYITYDIAGLSFLVTRPEKGRLAAFYNACLHRATELVRGPGNTEKFTCSYHGWEYGLEGGLEHVPQQWDFPHVCPGEHRIRPVQVASCNGIVFINPDPDAGPLSEYLDPLPKFLAYYPIEGRRQRICWVKKVVPCNWKTAVEAFQEGYHLAPTHPQFAETFPGSETETDVLSRHITRLTGATTVPNTITGPGLSEQQVFELAMAGHISEGRLEHAQLAEGQTARNAVAAFMRKVKLEEEGLDLYHLSDTEVIDHELFLVFPNATVWGSWTSPVMYRWRPNGGDHTSALMEVFLFQVFPEGAEIPPPAPMQELAVEETFASADMPLGFGAIVDQDVNNMINQTRGLHTTPEAGFRCGRRMEMLVRHFHHVLDEMIQA